MDPLSALSVAAAAIQFIDFGSRLLTTGWHVYHDAAGQSVELRDVSIISDDLDSLTTGIKEAVANGQPEPCGDAARDAFSDKEMLRLCDECKAVANELKSILSLTSRHMENPRSTRNSIFSKFSSWRHDSLSAGQRFQAALEQVWHRDKIRSIGTRLANIRTRIINEATISVWARSRETKKWEIEFSNKLDIMNTTFMGALESISRIGPRVEETAFVSEGKQETNFGFLTDLEILPTESSSHELVAGIQKQLWDKNWHPEALHLPPVPERLKFSVSRAEGEVVGSLRYETMDNRKDAIVNAFESTYKWIFDPSPPDPGPAEQAISHLPSWLSGDSSHPFWITGKPGSGKSTMMKFILDHEATARHLSQWANNYPLHQVSYYAWKPGLNLAKSKDGLIRSILFQILARDYTLIAKVCPRRWAMIYLFRGSPWIPLPEWTSWELSECLENVLQQADLGMRLAVFIDGLDEFEEAPVHLCSVIQGIARHSAVKVCVTSRPWPQFCDVFAASPQLEMHLLTYKDIKSYVFGQFESSLAFNELRDLHPDGAKALLLETVARAQGVFLWVNLVTQTMVKRLLEGDRLPELQAVLDSMPPKIEELYDAIYATIPQRLLPEMAALLRLVESTSLPVDWVTLWLADEARSGVLSASFDIASPKAYSAAQKVLKRRIGARTHGILDLVQSSGTVEYLHRTAAEWVQQPRVSEMLQAHSPVGFDPFLCLFHAEMLRVKASMGYLDTNEPRRSRIIRALFYASLVDEQTISRKRLASEVDCYWYPQQKQGQFDGTLLNTKGDSLTSIKMSEGELMQLCCMVAFVPYIQHKLESGSSSTKKELIAHGLGPAIWGMNSTHPFRARFEHHGHPAFRDMQVGYRAQLEKLDAAKIPASRRLELVLLLLARGSDIGGVMEEMRQAEHSVPAFQTDDGIFYLSQVKSAMCQYIRPEAMLGLGWFTRGSRRAERVLEAARQKR